MMLLVVLCFAHMVLFCVYNVFVGGRVMIYGKNASPIP